MYIFGSSPTVTNCTFSGNSAISGGGIYCELSAPTICGSTLEGNAAMKGGGMYAWRNSAPSLTDCEISRNVAEIRGAGIYTALGTDLTLTGCSIRENIANGGSGAGNGGGVAHTGDLGGVGDLTITNCILFGNISFNSAGAFVAGGAASITSCVFTNNMGGDGDINLGSGGGLLCGGGDSLVLSNCAFIDNQAYGGGGLALTGGTLNAAVDECLFDGNTAIQGGGLRLALPWPATLSNLVIRSNVALLGGGMYTTQQAVPTLVNSVFTGNSATLSGGGVYNTVSGFPTFINCTLSGNSSPAGGGIYNSGGSCSVTNSIIWDNPGGAILGDIALANYTCIEGGYFGEQIITEDPLFVDPDGDDDMVGTDDDNLRLLAGSPCIDAADNTVVPKGVTTDLDGNPRFVDDPGTTDTGNGKPPIVDMGAYEFQGETPGGCPWDLNGDGTVGASDLLVVLGLWGTDPGGPPDFDGDGNVGASDLLALLANWGPCP